MKGRHLTAIQQLKINAQRWIFIVPGLVLFTVFVIAPIFQTIYYSFFKWSGGQDMTFIGLGNYKELLDDDVFYTSFFNNIIWLVLYLLALPVGLGMAIFLNQAKIRGVCVVKSLFFFPFVISQAVIGVIFDLFYEPSDSGALNLLITTLGFEPISILDDENLVTYGIIAAGLWGQVCYCLILYITGLSTINSDLLEASDIDGAKKWEKFWHIVLPQLQPATFIAFVVTVIGALRSFDLVAIMTGGGPYDSSSVLSLFMYQQANDNQRFGYSSAIAVVLFAIMLIYIVIFLRKMIQGE